MRRAGTPAWMQVVDRAYPQQAGREQAVEDVRGRPAKAGIRQGAAGVLNGSRPWNAAFSGHSRPPKAGGNVIV